MIENLDPKLIRIPSVETMEGAVVFLHGYGSNGFDMMGLQHYFAEHLPHHIYVCPNAPHPCENSSYGFQWFSLADRSPEAMIHGVSSTGTVRELIQTISEKWQIPTAKVALLGFSQGAMTAFYHGLCGDLTLGAVIGFSGRLILTEPMNILHRPPLMVIHGGEDNVVPVSAYNHTLELLNLRKVGYEALYRPHLAHSIDETSIVRACNFLKRTWKLA